MAMYAIAIESRMRNITIYLTVDKYVNNKTDCNSMFNFIVMLLVTSYES